MRLRWSSGDACGSTNDAMTGASLELAVCLAANVFACVSPCGSYGEARPA
jgi:hypothetical protein